jgi:hypothetical protein
MFPRNSRKAHQIIKDEDRLYELSRLRITEVAENKGFWKILQRLRKRAIPSGKEYSRMYQGPCRGSNG